MCCTASKRSWSQVSPDVMSCLGNCAVDHQGASLVLDEDLSSMYLTAKKEHRARGLQDHEELELLLESFSKQVEEIVSEVEAITVSRLAPPVARGSLPRR